MKVYQVFAIITLVFVIAAGLIMKFAPILLPLFLKWPTAGLLAAYIYMKRSMWRSYTERQWSLPDTQHAVMFILFGFISLMVIVSYVGVFRDARFDNTHRII